MFFMRTAQSQRQHTNHTPLKLCSKKHEYNFNGKQKESQNNFEASKKAQSNADELGNLGVLAYKSGETEKAKRLLTLAITQNPKNAVHYFRLGSIHHDNRDFDEAILCYQMAVEHGPTFLAPLINLGNAYLENGDFEQAISVSNDAIQKIPTCKEAYNNLGQAYLRIGKLCKAREALFRTVELDPNNPALINNYGTIQQLTGDVDGAIKTFEAALKIDTNCRSAERNLKIAMLNSPYTENQQLFERQLLFGRRYRDVNAIEGLFSHHDFSKGKRLRVGYLTSDFYDHPVGNNLLPLLKHHNPATFDVYLYSCTESADQLTNEFINLASHWREVGDLRDNQISNIIKNDKIDIMVYLAGRFNTNRPEIAAHKPAPVQISFHDCGTTGIEAIDYWLTDKDLHPLETKEQFVEKLFRLQTFYQFTIPKHTPQVALSPLLHNNYLTFGCFNKPEKINQEVIQVWAKMLRSIRDSKLILKYRNFYADEAMRTIWTTKFEACDVNSGQLIFLASDDNRGDHLALYSQIDIALDPFPFNGATTTFESLLMGVPVIALEGQNFVDRVSTTLLKQSNLSRFIARTADDYINIAAKLSSDVRQLIEFRKNIRKKLLGSPLCDASTYALQVEKAYEKMWKERCDK